MIAVAAEDEQASVLLLFVEKDKFVRVQALPQECQAVSHNNHRQKSPWTELALQSTEHWKFVVFV